MYITSHPETLVITSHTHKTPVITYHIQKRRKLVHKTPQHRTHPEVKPTIFYHIRHYVFTKTYYVTYKSET